MPDLEEVVFEAGNENLTELGTYTFDGCVKLSKVTLPDHLETFCSDSAYTFRNCAALEEITLPETLTEIGGYVFQYSGLKRITIPALVDFTIASSSSENGNAFKNAEALEEVTILGKFEKIPASFFSGCSSLTTVNGLETTEFVGQKAFEKCVGKIGRAHV